MIPPGAVSCSLVSKSLIPATSSSFITTPTTKGTTRAGKYKLKWKDCIINEKKTSKTSFNITSRGKKALGKIGFELVLN